MVGKKRENAKSSRPPRVLTVMEGREKNFPVVEEFMKSTKKRGWGFCQILNINSDLIARYDFSNIPLDFVVFREFSRNNYHECERLLHWLRANHKICMNTNVAGRTTCTSDKHFQQGLFMLDPLLKQYALPTYEAKFKRNVMSYVHGKRVHFPFLLKDRRGTIGKNILLIRKEEDLDEISDFNQYVIEQYIEPECDFRVFVIGGAAVAIMHKTGRPGDPDDFHAWSGGIKRNMETDPEVIDILSEIATRAAAISKLEYAGIDILRAKKTGKYHLLETNIAAGWMNFPPDANVNISDIVLDWFEDKDDGRYQPYHVVIKTYLDNWEKYLPIRIQHTLDDIAKGKPNVLEPYQYIFDTYPQDHLYDAGYLFNHLSAAYNKITQNPNQKFSREKLRALIDQIEVTPFSWAGNFIGPDIGTFHDGAILSALYLYLRQQLSVKNP